MYMIEAFKQKKILIILIVDILVTMGSPFAVFGILYACGVTNFVYPLLFAIFAFFNGLFAYLSGDIILIRYRHQNDIVTSPIPDDVYLRSKQIRYPFIISLLLNIAIFVVCVLVFSSTGHWPLI